MDKSLPFAKNIKNIVFVMFENRSFDNLLGWLYNGDANPTEVTNIPKTTGPKFHGLTEELLTQFAQPLVRKPGKSGPSVMPIVRGVQGNLLPCSTPILDPHETFKYITQQIYQSADTSGPATMKGFLQDFYNAHPLFDIYHEILQTYDFDHAPIINTLGYHYGVSDEWFCSIPSQTSINRAFSVCGNSVGYKTPVDAKKNFTTAMVNNNHWGPFKIDDPSPFTKKTIWNVLSEHGYDSPDDWKIYYSDKYLDGWFFHETSYTYLMFKQLQELLNPTGAPVFSNPRYQDLQCFYDDASSGALPRFSYIEPKYTWEEFAGIGIHGTDYHPPSDIKNGEQLLANIYNHLKCSPQWENTLLVVAFDEHGGTFDHIPPRATAIDPGGACTNQCHFDFTRFGVRVPMLFISPWVEHNTVIRSDNPNIPFDHTSWLATLLDWFDLPQNLLGKRTAAAPKFTQIIGDRRRCDVDLPEVADCEPELNQEDKKLTAELAEMISKYLKAARPEIDRLDGLKHIVTTYNTEKELYQFIRNYLSKD